MKKRLYEVVMLADAVSILTRKRFNNWNVSLKIVKTFKELNSLKEFYLKKENDIIDLYAKKDENNKLVLESGNHLSFENDSAREGFKKDLENLQNTEVDIPEPITISEKDFANNESPLMPTEIMVLDGYINFKELDEFKGGNEA